MKIAYIMLCHKNPNQINNLIEKLSNKNVDIYLHIDLKSNIEKKINKRKNVFILSKEQSYSVNWGGNEMILATLSLIKYVKQTNKEYDYIWLISGQDFPIVDSNKINEVLEKNKGKNFIDVVEYNTKEYKKYRKLYEIWYPTWITKNKTIIKIIKRLYMFITGGFYHTFKIFKRKKPFDFEFNFGSQWWTLTSECAYYILDYCETHPQFIDYFNNAIIPDECFFQTIFMASKYKKTQKDNLTFVNWKQNRRSPETLTINDLDLLKKVSKKKCLARKFDEDVDKEIFNKL